MDMFIHSEIGATSSEQDIDMVPGPNPALKSPASAPDTRAAAGAPATLSIVSVALLAACGGGGAPDEMVGVNAGQLPYEPLLGSPRPALRAQLATIPAAVPTVDEFMNWAERNYPTFFAAHSVTQTSGSLAFRFYPQTGNYLGVLGADALVLGPLTGNKVVAIGTLALFAERVAADSSAQTMTAEEAARFLLQAQFSASEAEIAALQQKGFSAWLKEQQALPPGQSAWDWMVSQGYAGVDTHEYFFMTYIGDFMAWHQVLGVPDAVRQRAALALSEFFVVSVDGVNGAINWASFSVANYWDILCVNAFGNYRTLLEQITLCPAMGAYLNTRGNRKEDPASGRLPDENYSREVMQLFSIGLNQLNLDGSSKLDASGQPLDSYTQTDVSNLARVFTGYNTDRTLPRGKNPNPPNQDIDNVEAARIPMTLDPRQHSPLEKSFLGVTIPANTPGQESLKIALDTLFNHPNVGPFLGRQMIQRLVTSNPSPAYVARVASAFNSNPSGVRGDLGYMFRSILLDVEARSAAGLTAASFGKLREPMIRIAQWGRTFKVRSVSGYWKIVSAINVSNPQDSLAQSPLQASSVFNFFRPGYVPPSTALSASKVTAPEFQIVNESSTSSYINYLSNIVSKGFYSFAPEVPYLATNGGVPWLPGVVPDYSAELSIVHDSEALIKRLNLLLCAGQLSQATQQFMVRALALDKLKMDSTADFKLAHLCRAIMFVMCSAEYLVQK